MGVQTTQLASFAKGEIDPALWHRVTEEDYLRSCQQLQNFVITAYGTALKRNGTYNYYNFTSWISFPAPTLIKFFGLILSSPQVKMIPCGLVIIDTTLRISRLDTTSPVFTEISLAPMTPEQIDAARFISADNNILIFHPAIPPKRITFDGTDFTLADFSFVRAPCFDLRTISYYAAPVFVEGPPGGSNITKVHVQITGFTNDWVGGFIVGPGPDAVSPFGAGRINAVDTTSPGETIFEVLATNPFLTASGFGSSASTGADILIQQPIFTEALGYPGDGAYYQDRLFLTAHPRLPVSVFGSKLGTADNFDVGTALPTDAISYTMTQQGVGNIVCLNVGKQLQVFTDQAEFSVPQDWGTGLSPTSFDLKFQTSYGISTRAIPVNFQNYTFFAGRNGKDIYKFEETGGLEASYDTTLVSVLATHLIKNPKRLGTFYSYDRATIILVVLNDDNSLAFLSYNSKMNIVAWTRFTVDPNITVLDIDSVENILYLLVRYEETDVYFIEKMDFSIQCPLDSARPLELPASVSPQTVTGLEDYNGYTVGVSNGITFLGSFFVQDGQITVPYVEENFSGYVGVIFTPLLIPLNIIQAPEYAYAYKTLDGLYIDFVDSLGIMVDGKIIPYQDFVDIDNNTNFDLQSGTYEFFPQKGWDKFQNFTITQDAAVNMHITSIAYRLTEGGL